MALAYRVSDTVAQVLEIHYGDTDPSVGGESAPLGAVYLCTLSGKLYLKAGLGDFDWEPYVRLRVVGSGTTTLNNMQEVVVGPFTRRPDERLSSALYVTNDVAGAAMVSDYASLGATDLVRCWLRRTANSNEFELVISNDNPTNSRTAEWVVLGVRP